MATAEAKVRKRGVKTDGVLVETLGHRVADVIIEQARKGRADPIVFGTHGRRWLTRLVLGRWANGGGGRDPDQPEAISRAPRRGAPI